LWWVCEGRVELWNPALAELGPGTPDRGVLAKDGWGCGIPP